jgi:RNA polymerase sigma-70 factor, ECF subfamily
LSIKNKPYSHIEERVHIKKAQENPVYFGILYDQYFKTILLFVHGRIRNKEVAADITQQVFLKAMVNIGKYQDRGYPFSSWLYRIALNEVNMFFRSNKIKEVEVKEKDAFEIMNEMGDEFGEEKINLCLQLIGALPDDQNQLIEMRFFDKLSFLEIGNILGITEANAKMRLYRILEKLKTDLLNLLNR